VTGTQIDRKLNLTKPNLGFNYKLTPTFRVYASYSQSYFVSQNDTAANHYDPTWKPEVANGWDYGFKGSLLDDRLVYTVSGYYAVRQNVLVTDNVETPIGSGNYIQVNIRDGDQLVRGYEADITWRITKEFDAGLSYGDVYSIYTNFGSAFPAAIGRRVNGVSPNNGSVYLKYSPSRSSLKGFSANIGISHLARTNTEAPNAGDTYATVGGKRVVTSSTKQWDLSIPAFNLLNFGMRYRFPASSNRVDQTIALNVNNALDKQYLRVNRLIGEKREILLTYTINHAGAKR
jgi:outer membrane receptor protein involved in Fe transport